MKRALCPMVALLLGIAPSAGRSGAAAQPPNGPPQRLPTSPRQVLKFLEQAEAANAWYKELVARARAARQELATAVGQLRNGPFKAAGGFEETEHKRLSARAAALDARIRKVRDKMRAADKAGDKDERAALNIDYARLRARQDAARGEVDAYIVRRCAKLPQAKAAVEHVEALFRGAPEAQHATAAYLAVLAAWRHVAGRYRQKPPGHNLTRTRVLTLPPPADAERRRAEFAARNGAMSLEALAHRLFRSLDERAAGLGEAFSLYRAKRYGAALEAFRDRFFDKLVHPGKYGVPVEAFLADERPPVATPIIKPEWVEAAMRGTVTQPNRFVGRDELLRFEVGPPGAVNWAYVPRTPGPEQTLWLMVMRQLHALERDGSDTTDGLRGWLIDGYQATGKAKYLRRWAEYADDWAMNMQRDLNALPAEPLADGEYSPGAPLPWNVRFYPTLIPRQVAGFVTRLRGMVLAHPRTAREFPAATLARVLLVAMDEYLSPNILVARATRFNWNMMGLGFNVRNGLLLGEFKAAQWAGREAGRAFLNHATFSIMPDGGYVEYSDEGHQGVWLERAESMLQLLRKQRPAWFDALFEDELKASVVQSARFFLRHLKPDGYRHRDDYRLARDAYVGRLLGTFGPRSLDAQAPQVAAEPEARRILATVFGQGEHGAPTHLSDVMPYLGEFMLRGDWGRDAPFFYMHSPRIGNSNPDEDCNGFKLHAFGRHVLTAQPVYVDGRGQNAHFRLVDNPGAKTAFLTYTDGQPIEGRWHSSADLDLAEGIYEGAYEERPGRTYWSTFHTGGYDLRRLQKKLGTPAVTDVRRHTRQVVFLRRVAAWIVVDRVQTDAKHEYEVPYELYTPVDKADWLRRAKTPLPDAGKRVVLDPASRTIRTDNGGFPKVTMHHFTGVPLRYEFDPRSHDLAHKDGGEIRDAKREWRLNRPELRDTMAFVRRTLVTWRGEGEQVLATLITVAPANSDATHEWTVKSREGEIAFVATAPDGTRIHFAASATPRTLTADSIAARADTLLLVQPRRTEAYGLALGCGELVRSGTKAALPADSFTFTCGKTLKITKPIHPPIKPVAFEPNVNVFTNHVDATMVCATPGVEIRYTLDGGDPTPQSRRYTGPVHITRSAVIKAIAIRPGVKEIPWELIPGFATLPARAVFTRQAVSPPVRTGALRSGLAWEYLEGQPFALVASSDTLAAQKRGTTDRLFDVSMHRSGSAFTVRYEGFLDVPADGVYTFHAPREFVWPAQDPGYDLRVFVDGEEWSPTLRWHGLGTWSRALAKGPHRLRIIYTDTRTRPLKHETWRNWPNPAVLWKGEVPVLEISGPDIAKQPLPAAWLRRP